MAKRYGTSEPPILHYKFFLLCSNQNFFSFFSSFIYFSSFSLWSCPLSLCISFFNTCSVFLLFLTHFFLSLSPFLSLSLSFLFLFYPIQNPLLSFSLHYFISSFFFYLLIFSTLLVPSFFSSWPTSSFFLFLLLPSSLSLVSHNHPLTLTLTHLYILSFFLSFSVLESVVPKFSIRVKKIEPDTKKVASFFLAFNSFLRQVLTQRRQN